MANGSKIVITAGLQIPETVSTVEKELKVVGEKVSADRALKIVANVDLSKTTQRIQSQLATLSKNLKLDINTVNVNAAVNGVQKELEKVGSAVSGTSKNVGTIATAYAEGAKQSEILHQKQERLQQDYDILVAKIQKTKLALDTLATRDGTNYNEVFTGIMSRQIVDEASLNRARDALSAIRKEFQLANAQMTSDIPQNAIENFIQRIAKADSQIKILAVDYQELNNPPQALMDSFQKLQELAKGFNFSTDFKGESKESINAKIQAYTQIKVALNETQSLLQSAQKEESILAKEEENFAKKLESHNREIQKRIDLKESEIQKEREANEAEMGRYWQGRFEETVKGMTAENEELKKMRQYYADLENVAQTSLGTIKSSYEKIVSLNAKITSGKLPETEANSIRKQIEEQEVLAIKARQKLETEGLYTEEIAKQINGIKSQAEAIINARNQQKVSNEELAKSINTYEDGLKAIQNAYTAIADATKTLYSNKSTDVQKSYALADIAVQRDLLSTIQERLAAQGLIDDAINEEIKKGEILVTRTQQIAQSKAQEAQATRDERDAERELAEQARQHNKELKETESYIDKTIAALEKFNNSTVAKNNASNPTVVSQTGLNADLINQLRGLQESLANDKSPENIARIIARMNELDGSLKDATARSAELNQSLKDDDASAKFSAKLNRLKNQVDIFANTNRRATESLRLMRDGQTTFAQGWQNIRDALSSGNLDVTGLQRLREQFQNFRGEADAAGLTVSRFFQSMQSQLRMVLQRWISLYAVIDYIRKMIDNVKELDNAMINLRRVTDETDAGYERFLQNANELARVMKTTTSSLVEQAYQWSKLGYSINEALDLAQASTVFMKVADVGQDQALSNLVTTLKAFRIEADQTMDVVDKLDKLNNRYAVSAAELGQGLEHAASTMAMSGNTLEETLAMLTGAGEITQSLEETGNGIKILSLRLRGMKGALEELNEPVDDLMEVSKIQTQILNLTHNQVNIFDEATQEFRSTYDIMKDISDIWDSLSSTSRANLTEILFGKQRANVGLALIQAFQSGQVQSAFEDATNAAGTATEEYGKMMQGIQAQFDAFKGAFQEFSNAFINSDLLKGLVKFGTQFIKFLTTATDKVGSLVVVLTPILMYFGGKTGTNIFSVIINGLKGLVAAETGAITATGALTTALKAMGGALSGLAIGALVAVISYAVDKLIVSAAEAEETVNEISSAVGDLANATEELKKSQTDIENIAQSYSKIATTVGDVNERKSQLLELQNQLSDKFKDEADGIDLVNGKYSDQIKKMKELAEEQRRQYEIENADKIARARRLANLNVEAPDKTYAAFGVHSNLEKPTYHRTGDREGELALFTLEDIDAQAIQLTKDIDGAYEAYSNFGNLKGIYLSGTLEDARNQLAQIIDNYSKLRDVDSETLNKLTQRYKELNDALNEIKEVTPYIEDLQYKGFFGGMFDGFADAINSAVEDVTMQPFYDKVEEAQEKLKQLANPDDLTIAEYDTLYHDVQNLERELYKMADGSEQNTQIVIDLFNAFKQGISENGDSLEKFVEQFNTTLEESFKQVAETVTGVQDAMSKLAEGKGLSHSEAWKLLKEDTDGYLQSIKLVNGEYFFSQEELIKFKDAKIKASMEDLKASNEQYVQERKNQLVLLETQKEALKLALENLNIKAAQGSATRAELDAVTKARITIAETEDSIKRYEDLWKRNNLLIEELNQNLGETRTLSLATETELNNAVKALENEVKAVDDTIDSLNDRKELIEKEKSALQEELELLNEQKETIEETLKNYDAVASAVSEYVKEQTDGIQSQIDALEEERKAIEDYYNNQIDALKEQNEERDDAIKKEKALANLANAQNQKRRVYSSARGWTYEASKEDVVQAQNALAEIESEEQIKKLEKERDSRLGGFDDRKKEYETQIKAFEEYSEKYTSIASDIQKAENALLADQILGSNWREGIEQKDERLLTKYRFEYQQFNSQLKSLVNNEISTLRASIDAKDKEIKMIDNEIKAYNNYKDTVQTKLGEAKTELENYKNNVADYCSQISDSFYHMQDEIWNNHNKIIGWFGAVAAAARSMRDEIGSGAVGGAMMGLRLAGFANGGVVDSTGLAMLHGTKQKGEVIFNAADSKKLYDLVHGTPSLIANIAKQAGQIAGFNSTKVSNTNTNSINVNIGQVVANNPQELTRNLDTHLDSYFRRKLTQSYTQ